jgi:hypothetical protein
MYNPIRIVNKEKYIIVPDGVKYIDIKMIYNNKEITGKKQVKSGNVIYINNSNVKIDNTEVINVNTNT